jgi:hypothetical protein
VAHVHHYNGGFYLSTSEGYHLYIVLALVESVLCNDWSVPSGDEFNEEIAAAKHNNGAYVDHYVKLNKVRRALVGARSELVEIVRDEQHNVHGEGCQEI